MAENSPDSSKFLEIRDAIFTDADEWAEAVAGWDLDFQQLDCGRLSARIEVTALNGLTTQYVSLSRRFHQMGASPNGTITLAFPDEPETVQWFGAVSLKDGLQNFSIENGFECVSEAGFGAHTLSIPASTFLAESRALGSDLDERKFTHGPEQFRIAEVHIRRLRTLLLLLQQCCRGKHSPLPDTSDLVSDIRYILAVSLVDGDEQRPLENRASRQRAVDRAVELIRTTGGMVSLPDVCECAAVSARSLSRGFSERIGLSTKQYIVATRLAAARRRLRQTGQDVTEVACAGGFWHLGRFARDYRNMFGEKPSETAGRASPHP